MDTNTTIIQLSPSFLQAHYDELQFAAIFGGMILLFVLEGFYPRKAVTNDQTTRWISNIGLALFNHFFIIFYSLAIISAVSILQPESPLLKHFQVSDLTSFFIAFLIFEFIAYWIHRAYHRVPFLWRIHVIHHSDVEVDVTTSHRHHPFEMMINVLIMTPIVVAIGAPFIIVALFVFLQTAVNLISHNNIPFPAKLDRLLRLFIVTPDFHRMHHSTDRKFTDSNYGVVTPWFDYLFKTATYKPSEEVSSMEYGLETLRKPKDNRLDKLLVTPFTYKPKKLS